MRMPASVTAMLRPTAAWSAASRWLAWVEIFCVSAVTALMSASNFGRQ